MANNVQRVSPGVYRGPNGGLQQRQQAPQPRPQAPQQRPGIGGFEQRQMPGMVSGPPQFQNQPQMLGSGPGVPAIPGFGQNPGYQGSGPFALPQNPQGMPRGPMGGFQGPPQVSMDPGFNLPVPTYGQAIDPGFNMNRNPQAQQQFQQNVQQLQKPSSPQGLLSMPPNPKAGY